MKKGSGLKNDKKVQNILVSGSAVLPQKNSKGIRVARKRKSSPTPPMIKGYPDLSDLPVDTYGNLSEAGTISNSDIDGGIISGKLVRAKYDNTELKKSIDTNIFELIPQTPVELPEVVLRSVYNVVTQSVNDLTVEVQILTNEVSTLNSQVQELEIVSESLKIVADNEKLRANIAADQARVANEQVGETTIDLSNAIQNSINEAIQRVSLSARNEALLQENESLREQLFGLSAQTAEGAISGTGNNFTVKVNNPQGDVAQLQSDLYAKASAKAIKNDENPEMTNTIEVNNVTTDNKITKVIFSQGGDGDQWFKVVDGQAGKSIEPESGIVFKTIFNSKNGGTLEDMKPYKQMIGYKGSATNYTGKTLKVEVTFADGSTDSVTLTTNLRKNKN